MAGNLISNAETFHLYFCISAVLRMVINNLQCEWDYNVDTLNEIYHWSSTNLAVRSYDSAVALEQRNNKLWWSSRVWRMKKRETKLIIAYRLRPKHSFVDIVAIRFYAFIGSSFYWYRVRNMKTSEVECNSQSQCKLLLRISHPENFILITLWKMQFVDIVSLECTHRCVLCSQQHKCNLWNIV